MGGREGDREGVSVLPEQNLRHDKRAWCRWNQEYIKGGRESIEPRIY